MRGFRSYHLSFKRAQVACLFAFFSMIAVFCFASGRESRQEGEVVRIDTNLTNILFTALDKQHRFVITLRQEDIRVLEDGVPQEIFTFSQEADLPLSLALLIDVSSSEEDMLPIEKTAAKAFINAVIHSGKDRAAIAWFTSGMVVEQNLTDDAVQLPQSIDRIRSTKGSTSIWDALWITSDEVLAKAPAGMRRAIILLSDGVDTTSEKKMKEAVDRALDMEVTIYSLGIGDRKRFSVNEDALRKVSERTGGHAYFPRTEADLRAAFAEIQQELRSQYLVAYTPRYKSDAGLYHRVQIEVINPEMHKQKLRLTYRQGYFSKPPAR